METERNNVRMFEPERDHAAISSWWISRGRHAVPLVLLPKCGVIAMDGAGDGLAAAWLHMDNSIGLARIEHLIAKPGMCASRARVAIRSVLDGLEVCAADNGYTILEATTYPEIAAEAEKLGFRVVQTGICLILKEVA